MASKTRQHNVTAAPWAAHGDARAQTDLMEPGNASYGENAISHAVQQPRLQKEVCNKLQDTLDTATALDTELANLVGREMREWKMERVATH